MPLQLVYYSIDQREDKMSNKRKWNLINNNSHEVLYFSSEKKLRTFAKEKQWFIKHSYLDNHCFYIESYEYIPAG